MAKKAGQIPGPCLRTEKVVELESDSNANHAAHRTISQETGIGDSDINSFGRAWRENRTNWRSLEEMKLSQPQHC